MSEPENKPEKVEKPKGGGGGLTIVAIAIGLLNLGATGFVGFEVMHMGAPTEEEAAKEEEVAAPGQLASMDTFVVNLDESGAPRYLKAQMSLELSPDPEVMAAFETAKHKVRDLFLRYLSGLKLEDTRGESGKDKIRKDLLARAQEELGKERVKDIYFGEFVVQ